MDDDAVAYGCEVLFNSEQALHIQQLIETATGRPCPCKQGRTCPLLARQEVAASVEPAA